MVQNLKLYHTTFPIEVSGAALLAAQCTSAGVGRSDRPVTTTSASSCHHGRLRSGGRERRSSLFTGGSSGGVILLVSYLFLTLTF